MNFKRKFIIILLVFLFMQNQWSDATLIHQHRKTEQLTPGIEYFNEIRFYTDQWVESQGYKLKLNDEKTQIKALFNKTDVTKALPLSKLINPSDNTIGAINGDFFNYTSHTTIGPLMDDNKIIYNGAVDHRFSIFGINKLKNPFIMAPESFLPIIKINNEPFKYYLFNKDFISDGDIVLLNDDYGPFSLGKKSANITEILIENQQISKIYYNQSGFKIPKGSYVLSVPEEKRHLISNLDIGDSITIEKPKLTEFIETAIGGGSQLVKNGQIVDTFTLNIQGKHPRSAIGYSKETQEVIFLTVNGRNKETPGVTQKLLAELMIANGASEAINLDGGGSSTLLKRSFGEEKLTAVNYLSDGNERSIYNGLSVVSNYPISSLNRIKLNLSNQHSLRGIPIDLSLMGIDSYYNPIDIPFEDVSLKSTIPGVFQGQSFIPQATGTGKIIASYQSITVEKNIEVHSDIAELKVNKEHIKTTDGDYIYLSPKVITQKGYEIPISINEISIDLDDELYDIKNNAIQFSSLLNDDKVLLSYENLSKEISVNAETYESIILDDFESIKGEHIVYPSNLNGKFNLFKNLNNQSLAGRLFYDFTKEPTKTRASYYNYYENIHVKADAKSLSLEVFGYLGRDHWLRINIIDSQGTSHNLTLARQVNWNGWKTVEVDIPSNVSGDFYINRIYLVETDFSKADNGLILMDNLLVKYPIEIDLDQKTNYIDIDSKIIDRRYQQDNLFVTNESKVFQSNNLSLITSNEKNLTDYKSHSLNVLKPYTSYSDENKLLIKIDNANKKIQNYQGKQWQFLLEKLELIQRNNLIIYLEHPVVFENKYEKDLFFTQIETYQESNNSNVYIIYESDIFKNEYYKGLELISINPDEAFTLQFNFFNDQSAYQLIR